MMNSKNEFSISEAFKALNDIADDENLVIPIKRKSKVVNEGGITVNLNDDDEIKDAQVALEKKDEEPALQVIDPDADSLEHLKKKIDYVGQMILKCKACHGLHFIDVEELVEDTEEEDTYNVEDECPNCHVHGKGFKILGQVGEVPTLDNDVNTESEEESETEETVEVDNTIESEDEEKDSDDVEPDDTEDLDLPKLGDEFDSDDVAADDTEEESSFEATEESSFEPKEETVEEALEEETEEVEDESSESEIEEEIPAPKTIDLINKILESDDKEISIYDNSENVNKIFGGIIENIPHAIKEFEIVGFNAPKLIVNVDSNQTPGEINKVNYLLKFFNDHEIEDITVFDVDKDEEVFEGSIEDLLDEYKDTYFVSFEVPSRITLFVAPEKDVEEIESEEVTSEDALISDIIKENKLNDYKINNPLANEYWINDAVKTGEDLDVIYEQYVAKTGNKDLIERFKKITGYKDVIDEAKESFENKLENNKRPFNEDIDNIDDVQTEVEDKVYYDYSIDPEYQIKDEDLDEIEKYIKDKFFPFDIDYSNLEIQYGGGFDWETGPYSNEKEIDYTYRVNADAIDSDKIFDLIDHLYPERLTRKDLDNITAEQIEDFYYNDFEDDAREEAEENYEEDDGYDPDAEYDRWRDEHMYDESLNEEATLGAKNEDINKVADKIDKAIENEKISVQTVTDEGNPGQIGFLFTSEEDRTKAKPIIDRIFKEVGCVPGDIKEVQEEEAFGLTYDKIAIQLGIELKEHLCKNRKELVKCIKECKEKGNKYKIKRSLEEGYRYNLVEEIGDETFEQGTTETAIANPSSVSEPDPAVSAVLNKLMEVSKDTVDAIKEFYNVDVAPEFVLADMIRDLQLIKGDISVNDLEEDNITRKMYNSYNDFYNAFEDILSMISGETIHSTPEERFRQALKMLNSPSYSREGIKKAIGSDTFLELAKAGEVPYLGADVVRAQLPESLEDEDDGSDLFETPDTEVVDEAREPLKEIDPNSEVAKMMDIAIEKKAAGDDSEVIEITDDDIKQSDIEKDSGEEYSDIKVIYRVHSDVDENNISKDFDDQERAIAYAKENIQDETSVDKIIYYPETKEEDVITIWVYNDNEEEDNSKINESITETETKEDCQDEIKSKLAALTQDEWEAIKGYTDAANDIKDACEEAECGCGEKINNVLDDIRDEEIVHVGELEELIDVVDDDSKDLIKDGQDEAKDELESNQEEIKEVDVDDNDEYEDENGVGETVSEEDGETYEVVNDLALDKAVADLEARGISPADLEDEEIVEEKLDLEDPEVKKLTEGLDKKDFKLFISLCDQIGLKTLADIKKFADEHPGDFLTNLTDYRLSLGDIELPASERGLQPVAEDTEINPDDFGEDQIDYQADEVEFDEKVFDDDLNNYFNENYDETILYHTEKGEIDKNNNIVLEGYLETETSKTPVKFLLQLNNVINEEISNEKVYKVSNNLSDEVFEFKF